jgi:glycine oxidase
MPGEGQVNSPRFVQALALAAIQQGAEVTEYERVVGLSTEQGKVTGVCTVREDVPAASVVLAGGSTSGSLLREIGLDLPVHPVKGEVLTVMARTAAVEANVWNDRCYLVPKRDGRVIIGATEETGVHDRRPTLGGVAKLSRPAAELLPGLAGATFAGAWGGLRPGTPDGLPILGPVDGLEGLFLATGHYRNGVLLAPVTGDVLSTLALGNAAPADISSFSYQRVVKIAEQ